MKTRHLFLLLPFLLAACSAPKSVVQGRVIATDREANQITIEKPGGKQVSYEVEAQDWILLKDGEQVQGQSQLVQGQELRKLVRIWPARPEELPRISQINGALARDTEERWRQPMRSIGEVMPDFALYDQEGRLVDSSQWEDSYTILAFMFTRCEVPEMCPATVGKLITVERRLRQDGVPIRVLALSMDPEYDTPGILYRYSKLLGSHGLTFLTGPIRVMEDLQAQLGAIAEAKDGTIVHNLVITLLGPDKTVLHRETGKAWEVESVVKETLKAAGK